MWLCQVFFCFLTSTWRSIFGHWKAMLIEQTMLIEQCLDPSSWYEYISCSDVSLIMETGFFLLVKDNPITGLQPLTTKAGGAQPLLESIVLVPWILPSLASWLSQPCIYSTDVPNFSTLHRLAFLLIICFKFASNVFVCSMTGTDPRTEASSNTSDKSAEVDVIRPVCELVIWKNENWTWRNKREIRTSTEWLKRMEVHTR